MSNIDRTSLDRLVRIVNHLEDHAEKAEKPLEEVEVSFEFLIGSLFPAVFKNVESKINLAYTQGYIQGVQEKVNPEDLKTLTKEGESWIEAIQEYLVLIRESLENFKEEVSAEPPYEDSILNNELKIQKILDNKIADLQIYCYSILEEENED